MTVEKKKEIFSKVAKKAQSIKEKGAINLEAQRE